MVVGLYPKKKKMLHDFFVFSEIYTAQQCAELREISYKHKDSILKDNPASNKNSDYFAVRTKLFEDKLDRFFDCVEECNQSSFGLELYSKIPTSLNYNTYNIGQSYGSHKDSYPLGSSSDIKLTAILNISEKKFDGGEFVLFFGDKTVEIEEVSKVGSILVFPSFFYHEVKPVTMGQRITISVWFSGPNWK